jgi:hypothetical protein
MNASDLAFDKTGILTLTPGRMASILNAKKGQKP